MKKVIYVVAKKIKSHFYLMIYKNASNIDRFIHTCALPSLTRNTKIQIFS